MAAILSKEPPPIDVASGAPAEFQWIVQNCLAKDPDARWQSMGDVAKILKGLAHTSHAPASVAGVRRRPVWLAAAAAGAIGLIAGAMAFRPHPPSSAAASPAPMTLSLLPPAGSVFGLTDSTLKSAQFAVAPDGRSVVFVAVTGGVRALWLQDLSRTEARLLPGTSGASYPFWSPDSQFVGFFADGFLKKVGLGGRSPLAVCRAINGRGGAWSPDDRIVFAPDATSPLSIVNAAGGDPRPFTELGANRLGHRWPQVLRDGRVLLFVKNDKPELQGIYVTSLARPGELRQIRATSAAGLVVAGHLLFVLGGELVAQPLDPDKAALSGEPVPVGLKVSTSSAMSSPVSASESGVLATWSRGGLSQLVWFDRSGIRLGTAGPPDRYFDFRLSPDERRVALSRIDPASDTPDLGMLDLSRNFVTAVSSSSQTDASPIWSATGDRLVFRSNRRGLHDLFEKPALDNGGERLLHAAGVGMYPTDWSPDGRTILFHVLNAATKHDIWTFDLASRTAKPLLDGRAEEAQGQLAPGGRLAYTSDESGQLQVYVRLVGSETLPNPVSTKGGFDPRWRADGRELFFVSPDGMMTAAEVSPEGQPISSRELFRTAIEPTSAPYLSDFVVSKDGRKFLIKVPTEPPGAGPITVTLNWLERLRGHGR
jgi:Tol biopolymer transport system component